jgi:acetyltransferase-like isoleucine patch superfamily enzyme
MTTVAHRQTAVQARDRGTASLRAGAGWLRALAWLRLHGVEHSGLPSFVGRAPLLSNKGSIRLGAHVATRSQQVRPSLATGPHGLLVIGDRSFINQGAIVHAEQSVTIGRRVLLGDYSAVCDTDFHEVEPGMGVRTAPVTIGDDVWLARGVVVLPGSTIGEGTVVAAGSVVRGELPPWVVAAGSPARPVRDIATRGPRR